jgi:hypothetical protein
MINHEKTIDFYADFDGKINDLHVEAAIEELRRMSSKVTIVGTPEVPWFPSSGDGIQETDHPGFNDKEYRFRRDMISKAAL